MTSDIAVATAEGGEQSSPSSFEGIAILGSNPATVMMAPFKDPRWIIWACSPHNYEKRQLPRFDEWFEVHPTLADQTRAYPYLRWLETLPVVWMRDDESIHLFPGAKRYPDEEMQARFGPFDFTSSIALMQMRAIVECERLYAEGKMPEPKIAYFGIMQASPNEYTYQRPSIQHLAWEGAKEEREKLGLPRIHQIAPDVSKLWQPPPENF